MPRCVLFYEPGPPEVLKVEERPRDVPADGEVLLRVEAIGINRAEIAFRQGRYLEIPEKFPSRLGYEAAGVIEAVGRDVNAFRVGDKTSTVPVFSMRDYGVYGDFALVPAAALARYPESLSPQEAASIWMQYLTAYGALSFVGKLQADETVLITAGSSSTGIAAIQVAKLLGAKVISTTRSAEKREALLKAGADYVIVTGTDDLVTLADEITGGIGINLIFDAIAGSMLQKLVKVAAPGATIILYGGMSSEISILPLLPSLRKRLTFRAFRLFELTRFPEERTRAERFVFDHLVSGGLKPLIDRVFPLDEVVDAHRYMESNQQIGKIILQAHI
jgi:NADPH:quinone reductase